MSRSSLPAEALEDVAAEAADHHVAAPAADDPVVAVAAHQKSRPAPAIEQIVPGAAVQLDGHPHAFGDMHQVPAVNPAPGPLPA